MTFSSVTSSATRELSMLSELNENWNCPSSLNSSSLNSSSLQAIKRKIEVLSKKSNPFLTVIGALNFLILIIFTRTNPSDLAQSGCTFRVTQKMPC